MIRIDLAAYDHGQSDGMDAATLQAFVAAVKALAELEGGLALVLDPVAATKLLRNARLALQPFILWTGVR